MTEYKTKRAIRVGGYEFHFLGGPRPYLRIGKPCGHPEYLGAIDNAPAIRRLRDYLTQALNGKREARRGNDE